MGTTVCPWACSRASKAAPNNPLAPATATRTVLAYLSSGRRSTPAERSLLC
jgi:hypothetical protein